VKHAVEAYLAFKLEQGRAPITVKTQSERLEIIFADCMARPVRYVQGRGAELYKAVQPNRSATYHQHILLVASLWAKWCLDQKWLRANPFATVKPVGRKVHGADKVQLTRNESRQLLTYCLDHADNPECVLTYAYLMLGTRSSELTKRTIRDLDDDGRVLCIKRSKTPRGTRNLELFEPLTSMLLAIAGKRSPDAFLFEREDGSRWTTQKVWTAVRRVCKSAGVTIVGPQALRRSFSSMAVPLAGVGPMLAAQMGHTSASVTTRSYIDPNVARGAQVERNFKVYEGGKR
jgi:integrase